MVVAAQLRPVNTPGYKLWRTGGTLHSDTILSPSRPQKEHSWLLRVTYP